MTTMEKAARALCRSFIETVSAEQGGWTSATGSIDGDIDLAWREWLPEVRAVLEVFRELSPATIDAMLNG